MHRNTVVCRDKINNLQLFKREDTAFASGSRTEKARNLGHLTTKFKVQMMLNKYYQIKLLHKPPS